jgi:hypothetical protein
MPGEARVAFKRAASMILIEHFGVGHGTKPVVTLLLPGFFQAANWMECDFDSQRGTSPVPLRDSIRIANGSTTLGLGLLR